MENWSISDVIAFAALIISVISAAFSLLSLRIQKKLNTTNLQAIFYEDIFKNYLIKDVPNAARLLIYRDGKLDNNYKKLNLVFLKMMDECAYFAYANHDFYDELRIKCTNLDEKLVTEAGITNCDRDKQRRFIYSVNEDIMDIVRFINKNYSYCK